METKLRGSWEILNLVTDPTHIKIGKDGYVYIRIPFPDDPQYQTIARLVVAAPDMLDELRYVAAGLAHINTPWAKERLGFVMETIEKATKNDPC